MFIQNVSTFFNKYVEGLIKKSYDNMNVNSLKYII